MKRRVACGLLTVAFLVPVGPASAQKAAPKKSPYVKLAEAFPEAEKLARRRDEAQNLPLFLTTDPLSLSLTADFKAVNRERVENSAKRFDATLSVGGRSIPVRLGTRGHARLRQTTCAWAPLRVEFPSDAVAGTVFDGQRALKLVTHCRDTSVFEQYVLQEYLAYRMLNLLTPRSFRARLVRMTYGDAAAGKPLTTRFGMFIEDDDDVARRMESRSIDVPNVLFKDLDPDTLTLMSLFEYLIGNTDYSIIRLHNVRILQDRKRLLYPVPYDFDFSGLVEAVYSAPDRRLGIESVRDRLYRGPCRTPAEFEPAFERFRARKDEMLALFDSLPELQPSNRKQARQYIEDFYSTIDRKDRVKRLLIDSCTKSGM